MSQLAGVFAEPAPKAPAPTFGQAAERWWARDGAAFKDCTQDSYQNILNLHILPLFKDHELSSIAVTERGLVGENSGEEILG